MSSQIFKQDLLEFHMHLLDSVLNKINRSSTSSNNISVILLEEIFDEYQNKTVLDLASQILHSLFIMSQYAIQSKDTKVLDFIRFFYEQFNVMNFCGMITFGIFDNFQIRQFRKITSSRFTQSANYHI